MPFTWLRAHRVSRASWHQEDPELRNSLKDIEQQLEVLVLLAFCVLQGTAVPAQELKQGKLDLDQAKQQLHRQCYLHREPESWK